MILSTAGGALSDSIGALVGCVSFVNKTYGDNLTNTFSALRDLPNGFTSVAKLSLGPKNTLGGLMKDLAKRNFLAGTQASAFVATFVSEGLQWIGINWPKHIVTP